MVICPICNRIQDDLNSDLHHLIPKKYKGKETIRLHKICHQKIHSLWTEKELAVEYNTIEKIINNDKIKEFINWVKNKDPNFYVSHKDNNIRKNKRWK